jgi:predicted lipoprotein with Yx(FWY)xxD motif
MTMSYSVLRRTSLLGLLTAVLLSGFVAIASAPALAARSSLPTRATVKVTYNKALKKSILTDGSGRTLYMFTEDTGRVDSLCTPQGPWGAECPSLWPPLTSQRSPLVGKGIKASLLAVAKRRDGKRQVSYNGHPLYYWHGGAGYPGDVKPGDVRGQGFVNEWYVLAPNGTPIKSPA